MKPVHRFALWALCVAAAAVLADITATGPYFISLETFSPCDEYGTLGITFDVRLITDADNNTVYEGNLTFPYDMDDRELVASLIVHRWGSTGGWNRMYNLTHKDGFHYVGENFPNCFEAFLGAMGIKVNEPAPAGTYSLKHFRPSNLTFKKMDTLMYGRYKTALIMSKDGEYLGCVQFIVIVNEDAKGTSGRVPRPGQFR